MCVAIRCCIHKYILVLQCVAVCVAVFVAVCVAVFVAVCVAVFVAVCVDMYISMRRAGRCRCPRC